MNIQMSQLPVLVGERIVWLGSGSGLPLSGAVRWMGKLPEMGPDWAVGIELDDSLPYGGIDGTWGNRHLFTCEPKHGLLVPISTVIRERELYKRPARNTAKRSEARRGEEHEVRHDEPEPRRATPPPTPPPTAAPQVAPCRPTRKAPQPVIDGPRPLTRRRKQQPPFSLIRQETVVADVSGNKPCETDQQTNSEAGGESDYQWFEAKDYEFLDCRSVFYEPVVTFNHVQLQVQRIGCDEQTEAVALSHGSATMNSRRERTTVQSDDSSPEDTVVVAPEDLPGFRRSVDNTPTGSASRREKTSSGFFSFFRWFRKDKGDIEDPEDVIVDDPPIPSSPELVRSQSSSCGSVDSLFSTVTACSFAFIPPPSSSGREVERRVPSSPDTNTYRNRLRHRDRARELDRNVSLRKKYRLPVCDNYSFRSGESTPDGSPVLAVRSIELPNTVDDESKEVVAKQVTGSLNSRYGSKKRKAPPPPDDRGTQFSNHSLPNTLENKHKHGSESMNNGDGASLKRPRHRRTVSDSAKDKTAGAYCHVKGKRKAPPPPTARGDQPETSSSLGRKKRPAPQPPRANEELWQGSRSKAFQSSSKGKSVKAKLSIEEKERLISNIEKLKAHADRKSIGSSPPVLRRDMDSSCKPSEAQVVCNDSLKLERGILKSNKDMPKIEESVSELKAPVSPRPWYKRSLTNKESTKRDIFKSLEKKIHRDKDRDKEWMPEVGFARVLGTESEGSSSRFSFFNRNENKDTEKRRSQVSMLVNISELDREAAEIVQKEQAREQAVMAAQDARFYTHPDTEVNEETEEATSSNVEVPKRSSARDLISLFNSIGNVTKVTVNSSLFSKDGSGFFTKEGIEKRFFFMGESVKTDKIVVSETKSFGQERITKETKVSQSTVVGSKDASIVNNSSRARTTNGLGSGSILPGGPSDVIVEEMEDDFENEVETRAVTYVSDRFPLRHPPSISTIAEQSETTSSAASTITEKSGSNRNSAHMTSTGEVPAARPSNMWTCPRCTLENPRWKLQCEACDRWRPSVSDYKAEPVHVKAESESRRSAQGIDWEEKLKKYFPGSTKPHTNGNTELKGLGSVVQEPNNLSENPVKITADPGLTVLNGKVDSKVKADSVEHTSVPLPAQPSTFIGGRLTQDEKPQSALQSRKETPTAVRLSHNEVGLAEDPNVDDVRKARLAFFDKTEIPTDMTTSTCSTETVDLEMQNKKQSLKKPVDETEQVKLREMLKEMKNSLPKRPKNSTARMSLNLENEKNRVKSEFCVEPKLLNSVLSDEPQKQGAIKKILPWNADNSKSSNKENITVPQVESGRKVPVDVKHLMQTGSKDKASVAFITTRTVYEDIKVKRPATQKVSTSAQTTAVVRKIDPASTAVPVTVEDYSAPGIKDGVLYTSLGKEARRIGTGTFELIRPRDFASIKATKTDGESQTTVHVYANVPPDKDVTPPTLNPLYRQQPPIAAPSEPPKEIAVAEQVPRTKETSFCDSGSTTGSDVTSKKTPSEASSYSTASTVSKDSSEVERLTALLTLPKGLADFKADLEATPADKNMNTLAVNRLLRRLEASIAGGQHVQAAGLAKDLARLKISCSVTRQRRSLDVSPAAITVEMYVEDKVSHQGPIPLQVTPMLTVAQLKEKVQEEFEIPVGVQRWILGKMLASDDTKTLDDHNVSSNGCPLFLYLVAPDTVQETEPAEVIATPPPVTDAPDATGGGGWYYNEEDDRYSFCEESEEEDDEEDEEEEEPEDLRGPTTAEVHPPPLAAVVGEVQYNDVDVDEAEEEDEEDDDDDEEEEEDEDVEVVVVHEKPIVMVGPPVTPVPELPGYQYGAAQGITLGIPRLDQTNPGFQIINRSPQPFIPTIPRLENEELTQTSAAGPSSTSARDVVTVQDKFDTLKLGWRCPVCTLVNAPTRPGCAACTTERPVRYVVPVHYRANQQELQRIQQEQQLDHQLQEASAREKEEEAVKQHQHYQQLVNLDNTVLVPNVEAFDCSVCLVTYDAGDGVLLRECLHTFCRPCLLNTVQFSEEAEIKCPFRDAEYACDSVLQEREIKALVPADVYEQHLAKSISQAENKIGNAFHCKTPNCRGWCIFEDNVNEFQCPVCINVNCLTCQAIHGGLNCKQYQEQVRQESETNAEARRTREMLEEMVERGEAMNCPTCQVVLMKKWGCDWLRCSMCKTEICWVTRGPRWGPQGKGDVSGGCRCGLNGVKCHPRCNYCH